MIHYLIFGGKSSRDFGIFLSGNGTFNAPERDLSFTQVPGRNGDLVFDNGRFKNVELAYPAFLFKSFPENFSAFRNFLLSRRGYQRLEDTYHPEEFRMALFTGPLEPEMGSFLRDGSFTVKFNCKPQRFLKSGEEKQTFTSGGSLFNPTPFEASPLVRVYGSGILCIGSEVLSVSTHSFPYIDIDCDMMDAFYGSANANSCITLYSQRFPVLSPGKNGVSLTGFTKVEITPRWWIV